MTTDRLEMAPEAFFDALAEPAPAARPVRVRRRRTGALLATTGLVVVAAGALVGHAMTPAAAGPTAHVAALSAPQQAADVLDDDDVAQLVVQPASTRLLLSTPAGEHYVARSASGALCLVRVPAGDLPSEVCVADRVGADVTIGDGTAGQVRLVADGAPQPSAADGWRPAGPNVWLRG